jgi:hypothetical protein
MKSLRAHALLAFHLQLMNLQRRAVRKAKQQALVLDSEMCGRDHGNFGRDGSRVMCSILPRKWVNAPGHG